MSNLPPPLPKPTLDYGTSEFAACPQCGAMAAKRVSFTWWGGLIGPKMFTHVRCPQCRTCYNGKTGKSNNSAIAIYCAVSLIIALAVVLGLILLKTL